MTVKCLKLYDDDDDAEIMTMRGTSIEPLRPEYE